MEFSSGKPTYTLTIVPFGSESTASDCRQRMLGDGVLMAWHCIEQTRLRARRLIVSTVKHIDIHPWPCLLPRPVFYAFV